MIWLHHETTGWNESAAAHIDKERHFKKGITEQQSVKMDWMVWQKYNRKLDWMNRPVCGGWLR